MDKNPKEKNPKRQKPDERDTNNTEHGMIDAYDGTIISWQSDKKRQIDIISVIIDYNIWLIGLIKLLYYNNNILFILVWLRKKVM